MKFDTKILHCGPPDPNGATLPPICQASAFAHESAERLEEVFANRAPGFAYTRISNPTTAAFEKKMAAAEGGADAVSCSSGMAAVSMALLNILRSGDEIIAGSGLFGGTLELLDDLEAFGIRTRFITEVTAEAVSRAASPSVRAVFAELIGNPGLGVTDMREVSGAAESLGVPLIIDSTTATPALTRPLEHGAHIVVHSSSKYIGGSGNAISGVIIDGGKFKWDFDKFPTLAKYKSLKNLAYSARLRQDIWRNFGPCLAPQNAYLACLGLETLGVRMERACRSALKLAEFLRELPGVSVNYPGLSDNPHKNLISRQMSGGMGGAILTIRTGSKKSAFAFINALKYARIATNIGDVRTLVIHPASTIYSHASGERKRDAGVFDDLVRVSVGLEDAGDLAEDFSSALMKSREAGD